MAETTSFTECEDWGGDGCVPRCSEGVGRLGMIVPAICGYVEFMPIKQEPAPIRRFATAAGAGGGERPAYTNSCSKVSDRALWRAWVR